METSYCEIQVQFGSFDDLREDLDGYKSISPKYLWVESLTLQAMGTLNHKGNKLGFRIRTQQLRLKISGVFFFRAAVKVLVLLEWCAYAVTPHVTESSSLNILSGN